jgi:cbb3-type cytochrome oxidase subunit 3
MNELVFVLTPFLSAGILAFFYWAIDSTKSEENVIYKVLFMLGSLIFMIIGSSTTITLAQVGNSTATYNDVYNMAMPNQTVSIFVLVTFLAMFFVLYLYSMYKAGMKGKWDRELHDYRT